MDRVSRRSDKDIRYIMSEVVLKFIIKNNGVCKGFSSKIISCVEKFWQEIKFYPTDQQGMYSAADKELQGYIPGDLHPLRCVSE